MTGLKSIGYKAKFFWGLFGSHDILLAALFARVGNSNALEINSFRYIDKLHPHALGLKLLR